MPVFAICLKFAPEGSCVVEALSEGGSEFCSHASAEGAARTVSKRRATRVQGSSVAGCSDSRKLESSSALAQQRCSKARSCETKCRLLEVLAGGCSSYSHARVQFKSPRLPCVPVRGPSVPVHCHVRAVCVQHERGKTTCHPCDGLVALGLGAPWARNKMKCLLQSQPSQRVAKLQIGLGGVGRRPL